MAPRIPIDREELPLKRSLVSQILARLDGHGPTEGYRAAGPSRGMRQYNRHFDWRDRAGRKVTCGSCSDNRGTHQRSRAGNRLKDARGRAERAVHPQIDFDQEVALIYATYSDLLNRHQLTEEDADQLRALSGSQR